MDYKALLRREFGHYFSDTPQPQW